MQMVSRFAAIGAAIIADSEIAVCIRRHGRVAQGALHAVRVDTGPQHERRGTVGPGEDKVRGTGIG
jgi:hypothetical protein